MYNILLAGIFTPLLFPTPNRIHLIIACVPPVNMGLITQPAVSFSCLNHLPASADLISCQIQLTHQLTGLPPVVRRSRLLRRLRRLVPTGVVRVPRRVMTSMPAVTATPAPAALVALPSVSGRGVPGVLVVVPVGGQLMVAAVASGRER